MAKQKAVAFGQKNVLLAGVSEESELLEFVLNEQPDILFIDKLYNYSVEFIRSIRIVSRVIMFHNLCDGRFTCDAFILPAAHIPEEVISDPRWETGPVTLYHGFEYIVINRAIITAKKSADRRGTTDLPSIIISTGGSDPQGVLLKLLPWIPPPGKDQFRVKVLVGEAFMHRSDLEQLLPCLDEHIQVIPYNAQELINGAFAIATFGVTSYELLHLQIPILSVGHSEQNARGSKVLSLKCSELVDLGYIDNLTKAHFHEAFWEMLNSYKTMSFEECKVDGDGVNRTVKIIMETGK
jgi:spore coat polysaccharide biosynthesis predicted glycosyltransferase SpsG